MNRSIYFVQRKDQDGPWVVYRGTGPAGVEEETREAALEAAMAFARAYAPAVVRVVDHDRKVLEERYVR